MKKVILCCFMISTFVLLGFSKMNSNKTLPTEQFILKSMTNQNGTLAAHLKPATPTDPDEVAGREALSESLGLWMSHAVEKKDSEQFKHAFQRLHRYFMTNDGFVYWRLTPEGTPNTSANSLIDDLRIVNALYQAEQIWGNDQYIETARVITRSILDRNQKKHYLADYYDLNTKGTANVLSLSYIDTSAISKMRHDHQIAKNLYRHMMSLAKHPPTKNGFFPSTFDIQNGEFQYHKTVNMINQTLVALHQAEAGVINTHFLNFIYREIHRRGVVYGRYDIETKKPAVSFESPAVYGLMILFCMKIDQSELATILHRRMIQFRENDPTAPYYGGYINEDNTHIFDNLIPLLSTDTLKENP